MLICRICIKSGQSRVKLVHYWITKYTKMMFFSFLLYLCVWIISKIRIELKQIKATSTSTKINFRIINYVKLILSLSIQTTLIHGVCLD